MVITIMMMTMLIIMFSNNDVHIFYAAKMQACSFFFLCIHSEIKLEHVSVSIVRNVIYVYIEDSY